MTPTELSALAQESPVCECTSCCDGEHAGECMECAGWGETEGQRCEHCDGQGLCHVCHGRNFKCLECLDRGGPFGQGCNHCGFTPRGY